MVDAATPEHRRLALRLRIARDLEHVELVRRPDVDERQPAVFAGGMVLRHRRVEHLEVELVQTRAVAGEDRDVVHTVQEHAALPMRSRKLSR